MENFNSEISGYSFSIPSEPPDIRNWFSSYKYESFVLDGCQNFGGIYSEERDSDKYELVDGEITREIDNFDGSGEIRKEADELGNLNSNENSFHSPSTLSEPPDLRNWFSSYVYESPLLDTSDGFKSSVLIESECEKHELVITEGIKFRDEVANSCHVQETNNSCKQNASEKTCSKKLVKSSSCFVSKKTESHPLFSEPPDIGHWFPDYVYESPVLDLSDEFRDILSKERESNEDKFAVEESKREEHEDFNTRTKTKCRNDVAVSMKKCSNEFGNKQETKSIGMDLHWCGGKENLYLQGNLGDEKILVPSLAVKQLQASSINLATADSLLPDIRRRRLGKNDGKSSNKLINPRPPDQSLASYNVTEGYQRKATHGSNDHKEEKVKETAENGFITTRKNIFTRTYDENYPTRLGEILLECPRNKVKNTIGSEKDGLIKRKVLAETSNVQHCEAMEITGKWRCPQKSKSNCGPPLKQLRLEQWIHRV